jgi:hypothetical protein
MLGTLCFGAAAMPEKLDLPREQAALVAPPFVHPHEQATNQGPKIVEFTLTLEERRIVIGRGDRHTGNDFQRLNPRTDNGRARR